MNRSVAATISTLLVWALTLQAAEVPEHLKVQVEKIRKLQEQQLAYFEKRLAELQPELKTERRNPRGGSLARYSSLMQEVEQAKKEIKSLKEGALPSNPLNHFELAVGQVGKLSGLKGLVPGLAEEVEVINVLGPEKMLVVPICLVEARTGWDKKAGEPLMIYGWPTKGVVDGQKLDLPGLVEVTGTEQYTTVAGGAKTVFKISWFDADALKPYLGKYMEKQPAKVDRPAVDRTRPVRTWTDASGKFSVKASFDGSAMGKVKLRKEDGSVVEVDLDKLSADDQKYINGLR